jgi:hypothetical protein
MQMTARRLGSIDPSPTVVPTVEKPTGSSGTMRERGEPATRKDASDVMHDNQTEPNHERAARHAAATADTAISPDSRNLALAYLSLSSRLKEAEGFLEELRPLARKAKFYRALLVLQCGGEDLVKSEEDEEDLRQAFELERLKEEYIRRLKAANRKSKEGESV